MSHEPTIKELVHEKLSRVFGERRAREITDATLNAAQLSSLETADELLRFGRALSQQGGFEGAVGAMLTVQAVMRGARE